MSGASRAVMKMATSSHMANIAALSRLSRRQASRRSEMPAKCIGRGNGRLDGHRHSPLGLISATGR